MATVAVKRCDRCESWETSSSEVARVIVAGPRFDLCPYCRAHVIAEITGKDDDAMDYVRKYDALGDKRRRVVTGEGEGATGDLITPAGSDDVTPESEPIIEPESDASQEEAHDQPGTSRRSRTQAS